MKDGKQRLWRAFIKHRPHPQHLSGEAFKIVEPLEHSAAAYEAAIALLERKLGRERRKLALHLEELENIKFLRTGNAGDIKRFSLIVTNIVH